MYTYNQAFYELKTKLLSLYDERESVAIAHEVLQHITGLTKTGRLIDKDKEFTIDQQMKYDNAVESLVKGVPLQYVLSVAWFMGHEFYVNEYVLIPRPETEELVQWVLNDMKANQVSTILDIGAGSGCIAISLKLAAPSVTVTACDISPEAIEVSRTNAEKLSANINFIQSDFLNPNQHAQFPKYDIIVSNPPYIPQSETDNMHTNVKDNEPNIALFVPDNDPLIFYRAIARFGKTHLQPNGAIYCELGSNHAMNCKSLFENEGYKNVEIRKDMHGNWRMLKASI